MEAAAVTGSPAPWGAQGRGGGDGRGRKPATAWSRLCCFVTGGQREKWVGGGGGQGEGFLLNILNLS